MKTKMKVITAILFATVIFSNARCGKKEQVPADNTCKTCKAFNAGVDGQTIQKQVCTPEEETAFRNEHSGHEITCQ